MRNGFTLLELSIVLVIIAVIIGGGLMIATNGLQAAQYNVTVARMDDIERALFNYATAYNRIPCPSDLKQPSSSVTYGLESGTQSGGTGTGECITGMTPAAAFASPSGSEEGGVPTRALQLPDDYMYDGWGRRFRYAVDPTMTKPNALPASVSGLCGVKSQSAITVNDASGGSRTTAAMYALISHGANGHGAYTSSGNIVSTGSVNPDELTNCHCNSSGWAQAYTPTYVERVPLQDPGNALDDFDDIVTFKEPWQMQAANYPLSPPSSQCIYVTDAYNNRVEVFNTSGTFVMGIGAGYNGVSGSIGSSGSGNGQFDYPHGIAIDANGNVWVADSNNYRIQEFSSTGVYLNQFGSLGTGSGQLDGPNQIAFDASGNLWVVDTGAHRVQKFSPGGRFLMGIGAGYNGVSGSIGSYGSGNGQFILPYGVSVDGSGNIWVADTGNFRIQEFNSSGTYLNQFGTQGYSAGQFHHPNYMTFDISGNLWVMDGDTSRAQEYSSSGSYISEFGGVTGPANGQFQYAPLGAAIDAKGNFWLTDYGNNRIEVLSGSGTYLSGIGAGYNGLGGSVGSSGSANGQFYAPWGIAVGNH
jgi:prepilin-type N-terminal cleavage/methylation domain-containing protein